MLTRFLPPLTPTDLDALLPSLPAPEHGWILDPFGASPWLAVQLAQHGYNVLVSAHNPIARFLLHAQARPPTQADLRLALAELAAARIGNERLEPHLRAIYHTTCAACSQPVETHAFLWQSGDTAPYARRYTCPHCGQSGEYPVTAADAQSAARSAAALPLHRARALARIATLDDPDREHAEEALNIYPPRPLYVLFTLLNKLESLQLTPTRRDHLRLLLLAACDAALPIARERPKNLVPSARYEERNLWHLLENLANTAPENPQPIAIYTFPPYVPAGNGALILFEGALRDLHPHLNNLPIAAIAAALPRPNHAFWSLSALWAGWLWGRESAAPFKPVLRRRRYDWAWHATALHAVFEHLPANLPQTYLLPEYEPAYLAAALTAAARASHTPAAIHLSPHSPTCRVHLQPAAPPPHTPFEPAARAAIHSHLQQRAEPTPYPILHAAAYSTIPPQTGDPAENYSQNQRVIERLLTHGNGFLRYGSGNQPETGIWWHPQAQTQTLPLSERIEQTLVQHLVRQPIPPYPPLPQNLLTPSPNLIQAILHAYANPKQDGSYVLRPEDAPAKRRAELREMQTGLCTLAERLGFQVERGSPVIWRDSSGNRVWGFWVIASAHIRAAFLSESPTPAPLRRVLVLPGGRAALVRYRLAQDPYLAHLAQDWHFLKYRLLRHLLQTPALTPQDFIAALQRDPLADDDPQLRLPGL
ncbi:MAG: hypothetical protein OHK0052_26100 [Anaerolineales bacterium]